MLCFGIEARSDVNGIEQWSPKSWNANLLPTEMDNVRWDRIGLEQSGDKEWEISYDRLGSNHAAIKQTILPKNA